MYVANSSLPPRGAYMRQREPPAPYRRKTMQRTFTIRSSVDCIVAACAIRHGLTVIEADRDYRHLAQISALQERSIA